MVQYWLIVGGKSKGGVHVRSDKSMLDNDNVLPTKLESGSMVKEIAIEDFKGRERLKYQLVQGEGPTIGWISTQLKVIDDIRSQPQEIAKRSPPPSAFVLGKGVLPVAIMFPGQGSQYVNMMKEVQDLPKVKEMLEKAKPILGWDVMELCLNGPEEKLEETQYCQPVMFIAGLAGLEKLKTMHPEKVTKAAVMAGLSLGEYTALCAAGVLEFEDGLKLVKLRGEAMQEAAKSCKQLMLSVAGVDGDKLKELCVQAEEMEGQGGICSIANALFPKGYSCGGTEQAVTQLKDLAEQAGAMQAKLLKTGGGFHTKLMQPAAAKLAAAIEEVFPRMKPPKHTLWMNYDAFPYLPGTKPKDLVKNMNKQLVNTVQWTESVLGMIEAGVTEYYECGPMKQMKAMMKRINPAMWKNTINIDV